MGFGPEHRSDLSPGEAPEGGESNDRAYSVPGVQDEALQPTGLVWGRCLRVRAGEQQAHLVLGWDMDSGASREGLGTEWVIGMDTSMQGHTEGSRTMNASLFPGLASRESSACDGMAPICQPHHCYRPSAVLPWRKGAVMVYWICVARFW